MAPGQRRHPVPRAGLDGGVTIAGDLATAGPAIVTSCSAGHQ
jgi:hypothetical protein